MTASQLTRVVQQLCDILPRDTAGMTDGQLLERFLLGRDELAFEALVRRHGPMVLGVCRRVARNREDAEDAFQATFLVLVRKAASIAARESLANWLYGVAYNTARRARAAALRRGARERQVTDMPEPEARQQDLAQDWQPLLDQELSRLPERYRIPIVLCDLEGKSRREAARQLGVPEGTVAGRLARARAMLAKRLARHGPVLSVSALAALMSQSAASACVPPPLLGSTVKAAAAVATGQAVTAGVISAEVVALTEGVLKAMFLTKMKIGALVLLLAAVVGLGAVGLAYPARAAEAAAQETGKQGKARPRWEYKALSRSDVLKLADENSKSRLTDGLNVLGEEGWELVGIEPTAPAGARPGTLATFTGTPSTYVFKRLK